MNLIPTFDHFPLYRKLIVLTNLLYRQFKI